MSKVWQCLEDIHGLVAVPVTWRSGLAGSFEVFHAAYLRTRTDRAKSIPCPNGCGCAHEVVEHRDGSLVGVCRCEPWNCEDIRLSAEDVILLELNWQKLGRAIARAFGCDAKLGELGLPHTMQIASFSGIGLPVVLTIQNGRDGFQNVVGQLIARLRERFVLLAPTGRFYDAHAHGLLNCVKAGFFNLESLLTLLPSGLLQARTSSGELFSPFLPEVKEPVPEEVARQVLALIGELHSQKTVRKAPVSEVFRLYCKEGYAAERVAKECRCSKALVVLRLKQLRMKLGRDPAELRQLSSHFESIEDSLTDSRAKHIHRESAIDESRFEEED